MILSSLQLAFKSQTRGLSEIGLKSKKQDLILLLLSLPRQQIINLSRYFKMSRILDQARQTAFEKSLSAPELWLYGIFNFLSFKDIINLQLADKPLHLISKTSLNPRRLGSLPTQLWLDSILPLLSYFDLKRFQRVSKVAKALTLSKSLSPQLFRSDAAETKLAEMCKRFYHVHCKAREGLTNPLFDMPLKFGSERENILKASARLGRNRWERSLEISLNKNNHTSLQENVCNPAVSVVRLWMTTVGLGGHSSDNIEVRGTGKSFFGSGKRSVTCQDMLEAVVSGSKDYLLLLGECKQQKQFNIDTWRCFDGATSQ